MSSLRRLKLKFLDLIAPCRAVVLFLMEKNGGRGEVGTAVEREGALADLTMRTIMMMVVGQAMTSWKIGWKYMLCTTHLSCITTLLSKEVGANMSRSGGGIGGNGNNEGEVSKGATTRRNKGEASKGAFGNGDVSMQALEELCNFLV